jgi:ferric-dicitrate binding protein FerR (iron transport regulator)
MDPQHDELFDLIARSFYGELTAEETMLLNVWKEAKKSNFTAYQDYAEIWRHSNQMALPSPIDLPGSLEITRYKAGIKNREIKWMSLMRQIAAVLVLSVIFASTYQMVVQPVSSVKKETVVFQEVRAAFGTQTRLELPDGTMVSLNSGSTLKFPTTFVNSKTRLVYLSGEGNFKVAKNTQQPFVVDINKLQVRVLGTTFNVDAYPGNTAITIALVEGKILLQQNNNNKTSDLMEMKPNQVACYRKSDNKIEWKKESDLTKYTAWTNGKIVFSNDPVNTVVQKLQNWYNVDIQVVDKKLDNYRFTGTFIDEPLEQVLSMLNLTSQMEYKIIPAKKLADNSFSKRKIILKSKTKAN